MNGRMNVIIIGIAAFSVSELMPVGCRERQFPRPIIMMVNERKQIPVPIPEITAEMSFVLEAQKYNKEIPYFDGRKERKNWMPKRYINE